jgi:hypothetical protein
MCDNQVIELRLEAFTKSVDALKDQIGLHITNSKDPIEKILALNVNMARVVLDLYGNGQPGIRSTVTRMSTTLEQYVEEEREKERTNQLISKTGVWVIGGGVISSLIVSATAALLTIFG